MMIAKAKRNLIEHQRTMLVIWVMGRLEDAALEGCDAVEQTTYALNDISRGMYGLMKYRVDCIPRRADVIETLQALGIVERAEQVADVLLAI